MVQLEPNLLLTLKHLAPSGAVLSAEAQAALDHSIPIKRAETALRTLTLWGKIITTNGRDYLLAEGYNTAVVKEKRVHVEAKYFFTQDGIRWADLPAVDSDTAARAARLRTQLQGDPAAQYTVEEADPSAAAPAASAEGEEAATPEPLRFTITEVQRLRAIIDAVNGAAAVLPKGAALPDARNQLVPNKLFAGLDHPEKLESYVHRSCALDGSSLAQDVRGTWTLHYDGFKGVSLLRSLVYPGYSFYYNAREMVWGGLYVGDGMKNNDLVFML